MRKPLLSAAMIVSDEEQHLPACLRSIRDLVDEIVVVDTGSTDESVKISRHFGSRVHPYRWHDDFAAARNHGLNLCRGEWILYIDADERARPCSRTALVEVLENPSKVGCTVLLHARTGYTAYREMRLFRNHPRIRFQGLMHETIWPGIQRYLEEEGGEIGDCDLVIDHVGYDDAQESKHKRNLPLLQKALAKDPGHVYCWYHLGMVYLDMGERERAHRAWESGIEAARKQKHGRPADSLPFLELVQDRFLHKQDVGALLEEARRMFPHDAMLIWLEGHRQARIGQLEEAVQTFDGLVRDREAGLLGTDFGYDELQFTSKTYAGIGTCYYRMGKYGEGARCFGRAEEYEPENFEYRVKRQLCEHLATAQAAPRAQGQQGREDRQSRD